MLRRPLIVVLVSLFAVGDMSASLVFAQDATQQQPAKKKRTTLFDMLFGGGDQQQQPDVAPPAVVTKPKKAALPQPAKPKVDKSPTAVRLAVFGDSLAVDLAAGLDRLYQDDPNIVVINQGVGSSGFSRPDFFDWDKTVAEQVAKNSFDIAVMIAGINDRQSIKLDGNSYKSLTPEWSDIYRSRAATFVSAIRSANKPIIWIGLPPMSKSDYSDAISQISGIQRLATFSQGGEFLDIFDRFVDDNGVYSSFGPDLNGNRVRIRKDDGIHFSSAGADKLAFYVSQSIKLYYRGGGVGFEVADALAGTDAAVLLRPPYQGLGQIRLLEVAGAVIPLSAAPKRASDMVTASAASTDDAFDVSQMIAAPKGRVDDFGVGTDPASTDEVAATPPAAASIAAIAAVPEPAAAGASAPQ